MVLGVISVVLEVVLVVLGVVLAALEAVLVVVLVVEVEGKFLFAMGRDPPPQDGAFPEASEAPKAPDPPPQAPEPPPGALEPRPEREKRQAGIITRIAHMLELWTACTSTL